jgi:hypothetical protein
MNNQWVTSIFLLQEYGLPKVRIKTHDADNQNLFSPYPDEQCLGKTSMSPVTSSVQTQKKRIRKLRTQNKFYALNFVEKTLPKDSVVAPSCKNFQNQGTGHMHSQSASSHTHEGAEGWARLGREFDLQRKTHAYSCYGNKWDHKINL